LRDLFLHSVAAGGWLMQASSALRPLSLLCLAHPAGLPVTLI